MSRIKPYAGTSQKRLTALVRRSQTPNVPIEVVVTFGAVKKNTTSSKHNSTVLVTASDHNGWLTDKELSYRRISLEKINELPAGERIPFADIHFPTTTHAIIETINAALGLNLVKSEIVDEPVAIAPTNGLTFQVAPGALTWLEGTHFFNYVPNAPQLVTRATDARIPTDHKKRIRVLENSSTVL